MPNYLLAIAIGPVQDFIAAARRTRDLWYGSKLLSDVSKAVAEKLNNEGATLIFPPTETLKEDDKENTVSIANQVVAFIENTNTIQTLVEQAKEAAREHWRSEAKSALRIIHEKNGSDLIDPEIWLQQLDDILELYAAWVPLESDEKYADQHKRLIELLNARKNTRNFLQSQISARVRKSLLDGARESVLPEDPLDRGKVTACYALGIRVTPSHYCEPLDISGVVKRVCGSKMRYPSAARVAADPWIRKLTELETLKTPNNPLLEKLCNNAEKIPKHLIGRIDKKYSHYQNFPFDGTLLYLDRYPSILTEGGEEASTELKNFHQELSKLLEGIDDSKLGKPSPYLAVISADGDRMGEVLKNDATLEKHQAISRQLTKFSREAYRCIKELHCGACVYAGGDDVLALVPLNKAMLCARALYAAFENALCDYPSPQGVATLSVGIGVGHFMESLYDLRKLAEDALDNAKDNGRNNLSIIFQPRGGSRCTWHSSWDTSPVQRLQSWIDAFNNKDLPNTLPYELERLLSIYEHFQEPLLEDSLRLLKAKKVEHADLRNQFNNCSTKESMSQLNKELLLASRLAKALSGAE
ncbi:MAG: type III-B CRISPR-associated protein Cas10/Cmr2 [Cystobacterineae bacterium]|nr:type III-B CRISPR-associated protein Cas10/Cmr2 [Cystobacterineae bacterium]